jgi:hypothetical protein
VADKYCLRFSQSQFDSNGILIPTGSFNFDANVNAGKYVPGGQWTHIELWFKANTVVGVSPPIPADGALKIWIDGVLTHDHTGIRSRSPATAETARGFWQWRWDMVFGGSGVSRTRDDYLEIDHAYISGKGRKVGL